MNKYVKHLSASEHNCNRKKKKQFRGRTQSVCSTVSFKFPEVSLLRGLKLITMLKEYRIDRWRKDDHVGKSSEDHHEKTRRPAWLEVRSEKYTGSDTSGFYRLELLF